MNNFRLATGLDVEHCTALYNAYTTTCQHSNRYVSSTSLWTSLIPSDINIILDFLNIIELENVPLIDLYLYVFLILKEVDHVSFVMDLSIPYTYSLSKTHTSPLHINP